MDLCFHVDICQKSISDLNRFLKVWKGWRELSTRRHWVRVFCVHHSVDVKVEALHLVSVVVVGEDGGGPRGPQQQGAGGGEGHGEGEEGGALQRGTPRLYLYPAVRLQSGCSAAAWSVHSLQSRKNAVESWQQLVGISDTPSQIRKILSSVDTLGHYEQLNEGNIIFQITWEREM